MIIPGWLISILTFPGIIIHEFAHEKMCRWRGVPVLEVCYFRLGNPAGYVKHREPKSFGDTFAVSGAPFLINSFLAFAIFSIVASMNVSLGGTYLTLGGIDFFFIWLAASIGMHSLPSSGDAKNIWVRAKQEWRDSPAALAGFPIASVIYIGDKLRFLWFDAIYALMLWYLASVLFSGLLMV